MIFFRGLNFNGQSQSPNKSKSKSQDVSPASSERVNAKLDQQKGQLMDSFNASLRHQTAATGQMLQIANKSTAAQQVAGQQGGFYFKNWIRDKQLQFGATPIPKPEQPPITGQQMLQVGTQGLKSTPDVLNMGTNMVRSQREWNKASQLEDKILNTQAQQTLDRTRNPVRFDGDKFYDAFETPKQIGQVYKPKLLTPENGNSAQLVHSDRFRDTLQQRYGENPFQGVADPRRGPITSNMPQPTGYRSSTGWVYDQKAETYLNNRNKPEDLSWIPKLRDGVYTSEQARLMQAPY